MEEKAKKLYDERVKIMSDAIAMKEPDRIPVAPFLASVVQRLEGSSYRDLYYDYDRAGQAAVDFLYKISGGRLYRLPFYQRKSPGSRRHQYHRLAGTARNQNIHPLFPPGARNRIPDAGRVLRYHDKRF